MKNKQKALLALRYFGGHYKRFLFLMLAVSLGFAIITTMTSLSRGMYRNVSRAAEEHYGGQLFVLGFHKQYNMLGLTGDHDAIDRAVESLPVKPASEIKRSLFFNYGMLYFSGNSSRQKYIYGVDFSNEDSLFSSLKYASGYYLDLDNPKSIILSKITADQLAVQVGDDVTLKVHTKTGQTNTGTFIVHGIFEDESIFGSYKCFVDRGELNKLLGFAPEDYFSLGLVFDNPRVAGEMAPLFQQALEQELPMAPFPENKNEFAFNQSKYWEGIRHFVMTLDLYVSQVGDLLKAMDLISYFLYIMISLIVLVSISVTYKLIIHERSGEIGTMRAMGFQRDDVLGILLWEAFYAFIISLLAGALVSLAVLKIVSFISFSAIPGIEIFLHQGRMVPHFLFRDAALNISLLFVIIFPALLVPALKATKLKIAAINN